MQNAVRSPIILTDFRCFTDSAIFGCSTRMVQSQELIIAATVTTGVGLIGAYKVAWQVTLSERYRVRLYMAVDNRSLTLHCILTIEFNLEFSSLLVYTAERVYF